MKLILIFSAFTALCTAEIPEALEGLQMEFYLPYSETEDVDFSIVRPAGYGCYQWSTDSVDFVKLNPMLTNFELMCGNKLEFQIIQHPPKQEATIKITAENVELSESYDSDVEIPAIVEYTIYLRPIAKMEVLGLKTELVAGSASTPFGVSAYDAEDNEFDTLDGVQISWYLGSARRIAEFERAAARGPVTKVLPTGAGKGAVIAILSDKNYKHLEPAMLEFTVSSSVFFEPSNLCLLEGGKVSLKVFEYAMNKELGEKVKTRVNIGNNKDDLGYYFEVKDPEFLRLDDATGNMTALKEGETYLFLKNAEGETLKGTPVWVTSVTKIFFLLYKM